MRANFRELWVFLRFVVVGAVNALMSFGLFSLFVEVMDIHYVVANVLVFVVWLWFGFELQRSLAFRSERNFSSFVKYLLNQALIFAISTVLLVLCIEVFGFRILYGYLLTLCLVTSVSFLLSRFWVFTHRP